MTQVNFDLRAVAATGRIPVDGRIRWQPVERRTDGGVVILPEVHGVQLVAGLASAELDPGYYWFTEATAAGASTVRLVPAVGPVDYAALVAVDPATLAPSAVPDPAWVAMAEATVSGGSIVGDDLVLERTDGGTVNAGNVRGPIGPVPDLSIGQVTTGDAGSAAAAAITGTDAAPVLDLTIPQGAKGDPGGWTASTILAAGTSLDTVITSGLYLNPQSNVAAGPAGQTNGGHMKVLASANWIHQWYYPIAEPRVYYTRNRTSSNVWSAWRVFAAQRVDQAAGRAIYTWDDLNNREQLVYGDTGWRTVTVTPVAGAVTSGSVRYRRIGSQVYLRFIDVLLAAGSGYCPIILSTEVPVGFRPISNERSQQSIGLGNNALAMQVISIFGEIAWSKTIDTAVSTARPTASTLSGTVQWVTDEAWPTVLPGTAAGSIPNL